MSTREAQTRPEGRANARNEAAQSLLAWRPSDEWLAQKLDEALASEHARGREEGRIEGRSDSNIGYREGYAAGANDARRETVRRIRHRVGVESAPTGNGQAARRVRRWLDAILDEVANAQEEAAK